MREPANGEYGIHVYVYIYMYVYPRGNNEERVQGRGKERMGGEKGQKARAVEWIAGQAYSLYVIS